MRLCDGRASLYVPHGRVDRAAESEGEVMRTLEQILEEMQKLPTKPDDITHQIADELLIEALLLIGRNSDLQKQTVLALISAYNQIEKWYA